MLIITLEVDAPGREVLGVKERIAMALEHLGGVRVLSVEDRRGSYRQLRLGEQDGKQRTI